MTGRDVHPHDMFDDDPSLSAFARDVREATDSGPLPELGGALAAVLAGRAPATAYPETEPPAAPSRGWTSPRWRIRLGLAAVGAAAAVLVFGAAGSLPDPAQRQVARLASAFGLNVPDGDDGGEPVETTTTSITTSTTAPTTTSTAPTTTVTAPVATTAVAPATTTTEPDEGRGNSGRGRDDEEDDDGPGRGRDDDDKGDDTPPTTDRRDDDHSGPGGGNGNDEDDDEDRSGPGAGEDDDNP
jgi:hypothetical protein